MCHTLEVWHICVILMLCENATEGAVQISRASLQPYALSVQRFSNNQRQACRGLTL